MNSIRFTVLALTILLVPVCQARAATYYVRKTGDNANSGTSPGSAWRSIRKAANNVNAGDTVYFGAGTYQHRSSVIWSRSGTASSPIKLIADVTGVHTGDAGDVILRNPTGSDDWIWNFSAGQHYQVTGFKFQRDPAAPTSDPYKLGVLLYPTFGAPTANTSAYAFTNCTFENLYFDCASVESPTVSFTNCTSIGNKYVGLYMYRSGVTVKNCTFKDQQYLPIYCDGSTSTCEVTDSLFTNNVAYGLYTWQIASLKSKNNIFTDTRYSLIGSANTVEVSGCTFSLTDAFSRANWGNYAAWIGSPTNGAVTMSNSTITGYEVGAYVMSNDASMTSVNITGMGTNYYNSDWTTNSNWRDSYGVIPYGYPNSDGTWSYCKRFKYASGTLSDCYIGIYCDSTDPTVENATLASDMYGVYGVGNYSPGNAFTITGSTIKDCLWNGISVTQGASFTATNSKFQNNGVNKANGGWAWGWGASITGFKPASGNYWDGVAGSGTLNIQNCQFTGNGSGFYAASFKKENCTFAGNTINGGLVMSGNTPASRFGWGAWLGNGDYLLQNNAEFSIQNCYYGLGGDYGKLTVKNYTIQNNYNGAYCTKQTALELANCAIAANKGSGIYTSDVASANIHDCTFDGNGNGGVFHNGNETVRDCTFKNSTSAGLVHDHSLSALTERVVCKRNGTWGYQAYGTKSAIAKNCVIVGNGNGAYLWDTGTGAEIWNCTIANSTIYGGIRAYAGKCKAYNCIVANNTAYGIYDDTQQLDHGYNLVYGHQAGTNYYRPDLGSNSEALMKKPTDLAKPPRFVNSQTGDFRLAKGSPAINSGLNSPGVVDNDMLGNARPMYKVTEMGAYEYIDPSGSVRIVQWNEKK